METTVFDESESPIQQFYKGRCVFITGGTGFVGKVLAEKLLRCCPGMKTLYLLIRSKKGKTPKERLEMMLEKECFDLLKEKLPTFRDKIVVVAGDVSLPQCGMSDEDFIALQRDVSIVFHSAACVQFLDTLRNAVKENMIGTRNVLELCKQLPHMEAFVHLSTAFARREPDYTVPEEVGGCHVTPTEVLAVLKVLDDESLAKVTKSIVKTKYTTYQLSKALAEILLEEEKGNVPLAIVRPCIVAPSWKEPIKGWCDIFQGMSGLTAAAAKGFLRTTHSPKGFRLLAIPVDVVVNCMIASAWHVVMTRSESTFLVNCVMRYEEFPVGEDLFECAHSLREVMPPSTIYRYPDLTLYRRKWLHQIHAIIDHYIPAIIIDTLLFIFTGKTLMLRLYRRIENVLGIFLEEGLLPWYFCCDNLNKLRNALSTNDSEIFFLDMKTLDWEQYIRDAFAGGRRFLLKESPSTIPYALKKSKIWWLITTILKWCFMLFFIYYMIPQSFIDSATTHFSSYLYTSKSVVTVSPEEMNPSDDLDTHVRI